MRNIDFMKRAIVLSIDNIKNSGGPFGCVIVKEDEIIAEGVNSCLLYTSPSPRDRIASRMPSSA